MSQLFIARRNEPCDPRRSRGLAAAEFVITVPVVLLLMLVTAELGRAFIQFDTLSYSIRNSARFLSEHAIEGATDVVSISDAVATDARNLAVFGNVDAVGEPVLPGFTTGHVQVVNAGNNNIEVRVEYPYQPMLAEILPAFPMRIIVTMRAIS